MAKCYRYSPKNTQDTFTWRNCQQINLTKSENKKLYMWQFFQPFSVSGNERKQAKRFTHHKYVM